MSVLMEALQRRGIGYQQMPHAKTFTSLEEAEALGIPADSVLKSVVLDTEFGHALAVIPGSRRLDMHLVERAVGDREAHLATEEELRRDFPTVQLGAFPPLGSALGVPTFVDPEVFGHDTVVCATGDQAESVSTRSTELFRDEPVVVTPLVRDGEYGA